MAINDTLIALPNIPILLLVYFVMRDQMTWPMLAIDRGAARLELRLRG